MTLPALAPCLVHCLDCEGVRALRVDGRCETCGSASVMREPDTTRLPRMGAHPWPPHLYRPAVRPRRIA